MTGKVRVGWLPSSHEHHAGPGRPLPRTALQALLLPQPGLRCAALAHHDWHPLGIEVEPEGFSSSTWASLVSIPLPPTEEDQQLSPFDQHQRTKDLWHGARCVSCGQWSIWLNTEMVYPHPTVGPPPRADMPADARELHIEAARVAVVSRRAAGALARATVERLLKNPDIGATGKDLFQRIESLQGQVTPRLRTLLHLVRDTANELLHEKGTPSDLTARLLDDEEGPRHIELFLDAANLLVDERITNPRELEKAVQAAPRVRELLEKTQTPP